MSGAEFFPMGHRFGSVFAGTVFGAADAFAAYQFDKTHKEDSRPV